MVGVIREYVLTLFGKRTWRGAVGPLSLTELTSDALREVPVVVSAVFEC